MRKRKNLGQSKDITFSWITQIDPKMEQWRSLAEEWLDTIIRGKNEAIKAMGKFLNDYIYKHNLTKVPAEFLRRDYQIHSFYDLCFTNFKSVGDNIKKMRHIENFLNWVLENYFSVEDDMGNKIVPSEYHNPITLDIPNRPRNSNLSESDKNTLPYHYIKKLRKILVPNEAYNFNDLSWAIQAMEGAKNGSGDWFLVDDYSIIDKNDPDCVWRKRKTTKYEQNKKGYAETVYEMWSPVRAIALYTKLLLPLRTYQVRMLDSGESDTYRYIQSKRDEVGHWIVNTSSIKEGTEKYPVRRGVFRKFFDPVTKIEMTGFYINTNKTADIDKEEYYKGYEIPWQYEEVLYWLSKLRDWQEKYNHIESKTPWTELERIQLGAVKDQRILKQMGASAFLFRDPTCEGKSKPIRAGGLDPLWHKLLSKLEREVQISNATDECIQLKFIKNKQTTLYPLHSLRVSLITAYALEGGVPMPILSKCIAGHARLVMTLYYTKAGITYISEKMNEAERKLAEEEQDSYARWIKDATYKQLEAYCAINDPTSLQAVLNAQQSIASFIKDDKGICPKACLGCDTGYIETNDDTGKKNIQPVPGYPEQNCVRCRWFITGPAFLPGLVHHFNVIGYNIGETAERLMRFESNIEELENMKFEAEQNGDIFQENEKLLKFEKLYQQELQKNDKLANDYNATLRLIDRCIKITQKPYEDNEIQLVAVGQMEDIEIALSDEPNKLFQLQTICNGAEIFPETDASKAVLERSQIIDLTLAMNNKQPVFFTLTPEEQLIAGNAWMRLLINRAGSLKNAVPYLEGRKKLAEMGLERELDDVLKTFKISSNLLIDSNSLHTQQLISVE